MTTNRINPLSVARNHPKKTAGACAVVATILGFIQMGAPICPVLPPPASAICMAITAGASVASEGINQLDNMKLDEAHDGGDE